MVRKESLSDERIIYRIKIDGKLHEKWAQWLNGMIIKIKECSNNTIILITVPDQAALRGILNKLWDLNLTLISVTQPENEINIGGSNEY